MYTSILWYLNIHKRKKIFGCTLCPTENNWVHSSNVGCYFEPCTLNNSTVLKAMFVSCSFVNDMSFVNIIWQSYGMESWHSSLFYIQENHVLYIHSWQDPLLSILPRLLWRTTNILSTIRKFCPSKILFLYLWKLIGKIYHLRSVSCNMLNVFYVIIMCVQFCIVWVTLCWNKCGNKNYCHGNSFIVFKY